MALEKSGADLAEAESYPEDTKEDTSDEPAPSRGEAADAPGSVGAGSAGSVPSRSEAPTRGPKAAISVAEPGGGGDSRR
jgi:hypothetical protein